MAPPIITLRLPSKYATDATTDATTDAGRPGPSEDWLCGRNAHTADTTTTRWWSVTHSTLALWRTAQNVRIRYRPRPPRQGYPSNEDRVEYEKIGGGGRGVSAVEGVNVASSGSNGSSSSSSSSFDWRGKGWLFFVTSHWEVLGWGEAQVVNDDDTSGTTTATTTRTERWAVTWFAPTLFTKEGLDIYSDCPAGLSPQTEAAVLRALKEPPTPWPAPLAALVAQLQPVAIRLPWQTV